MAPTLTGGFGPAATRRSLLIAGAAAAAAVGGLATATSAAAATTSSATPNWFNVVSYGADPTGATDSTSAFSSAITDAEAAVAAFTPLLADGGAVVYGNFNSSISSVDSAVLSLAGSGSANGFSSASSITGSMLDIGVACGMLAGASHTPQTISFGTDPGNQIAKCYGALNFGANGDTFTASNNKGNISSFVGLTSGDPTLPGQWVTYTSGFPSGVTGQVSFRALPTANDVMVAWDFTIAGGTTLSNGGSIVTVNTEFAYGHNNKILSGNSAGGGLSGNVYAPANLNSSGAFAYFGPTYTSAGSSYGQGVYTLDLG